MKKNISDTYMTIGDLALLYEMPKQSLIYYATSGVLEPAYIEKNGYRYFSVNEFLMLEIILNLRKIGVPSQEIKSFLQGRNTEKIIELLKQKKATCQKQADELYQTAADIQFVIDNINIQDDLITGCFQTLQMPETTLIVSKKFDKDSSPTHIPEFAKHNLEIFPKAKFRCAATGWIIDKDSFLAGKINHSKYYFTPLPPNRKFSNTITKPAGLYVLLNFRGTYYSQSKDIQKRLIDYLNRNHLEMISDVYNYPLKNHWQTADYKEYLNQLTVQVKYKGE